MLTSFEAGSSDPLRQYVALHRTENVARIGPVPGVLLVVSATATSPAKGTLERVLPDGCLEWIFHLGAPFQRSTPAGAWERQPRSFVVGELTRFLLLQSTGDVSVMGVRFRPGGFLAPQTRFSVVAFIQDEPCEVS